MGVDIWLFVIIVYYVCFYCFCFIVGKSGCLSDKCVDFVEYIISYCVYLKFLGLMIIGEMNYDWS